MSNYAVVEVSWTPSVSPDLAEQFVWMEKYDANMNSWISESGLSSSQPAATSSLQIDCEEKTTYRFHVQAVDTAGLYSATASYEFSIGDLTNPEATTNLSHSIVEVKQR